MKPIHYILLLVVMIFMAFLIFSFIGGHPGDSNQEIADQPRNEHGSRPAKPETTRPDSISYSSSRTRNPDTGNDRSIESRRLLSQSEVEELGIPGLSFRARELSPAYIEFAGLDEDEVEFLMNSLADLMEEFKKLEAQNATITENTGDKVVVFLSAFPEEGERLEGEFREKIRSRIGHWQEDFFMKLNRTHFNHVFAEFGRMESQFTMETIENADQSRFQDPYKFTLATVTPVELFEPKALAHSVDARRRSQSEFHAADVPDRFSHLFELE